MEIFLIFNLSVVFEMETLFPLSLLKSVIWLPYQRPAAFWSIFHHIMVDDCQGDEHTDSCLQYTDGSADKAAGESMYKTLI